MKSSLLCIGLVIAMPTTFAQGGGSGAPSPTGQSITPRAASAAEQSVEARHERVVARSQERAAKRVAKAASAGSH